jgi:hypothetical protein
VAPGRIAPPFASPSIAFLHRHLQPLLEKPHPAPVANAPSQTLEQLRVWDGVEVAAQIGVHYLFQPTVQPPMHFPHGIVRVALGPVSILFVLQIGLEDWFQYQNRRHLNHSIPDDGERPFKLHL